MLKFQIKEKKQNVFISKLLKCFVFSEKLTIFVAIFMRPNGANHILHLIKLSTYNITLNYYYS